MSQPETRLWTQFQLVYPAAFTEVAYDVRVGCGHVPHSSEPAWFAKMCHALTTKRIDVIGFHPSSLTLIEIKQYVGLTAPGQLIAYRDLFLQTYDTAVQPELALIFHHIDPDLLSIARQASIALHQLPRIH